MYIAYAQEAATKFKRISNRAVQRLPIFSQTIYSIIAILNPNRTTTKYQRHARYASQAPMNPRTLQRITQKMSRTVQVVWQVDTASLVIDFQRRNLIDAVQPVATSFLFLEPAERVESVRVDTKIEVVWWDIPIVRPNDQMTLHELEKFFSIVLAHDFLW